jgi:hypothetical protein
MITPASAAPLIAVRYVAPAALAALLAWSML